MIHVAYRHKIFRRETKDSRVAVVERHLHTYVAFTSLSAVRFSHFAMGIFHHSSRVTQAVQLCTANSRTFRKREEAQSFALTHISNTTNCRYISAFHSPSPVLRLRLHRLSINAQNKEQNMAIMGIFSYNLVHKKKCLFLDAALSLCKKP